VGTASGFLPSLAARRGARVTGIDAAPELIDRGVGRDALEPLAAALRRKEIRKGGFVWLEESSATAIFIVVEGRIEVSRTSPHGEQLIVDLYRAGDVGGLPSILIEV
jgi:CRP-like cAMP-binding protein